MTLVRLKVKDVRNLEPLDIRPSPALNLICGPNGSGKTSLLEAIHILGRGRSFRAGRIQGVIRQGRDRLIVFGEGLEAGRRVGVGVERSGAGMRARLGGRELATVAELAHWLPLMVIAADSHRLLEEGPRYRRQFLDWGVFHVEPNFFPAWMRYQRALRQRNAALREHQSGAAVGAWEAEIIALAERIDQYRRDYLERLLLTLPPFIERMSGLASLEVRYLPGWPAQEPYGAVLRRSVERDRALGHTQYGPHRADLALRLNGVPAQEFVSRGQQKVLVAALRLAQVALLRELTGRACLVLIDDLAAELDAGHRAALLRILAELGVQVFVTAVEPELVATPDWQPQKLFHVEHGRVVEMV